MLIDTLTLILSGTEPLPPALLIYGEEEFLREEAYHAIMHKILPEGMHHDIEIIDAENSSESQIVDIADAYPFISEKKNHYHQASR